MGQMGQLLTILSFPFVLMRQQILPVDIKYSSVHSVKVKYLLLLSYIPIYFKVSYV